MSKEEATWSNHLKIQFLQKVQRVFEFPTFFFRAVWRAEVQQESMGGLDACSGVRCTPDGLIGLNTYDWRRKVDIESSILY